MFLADTYLYTARYLYNSRFLGGEPAQFFPIFPSFGIFRGGKLGLGKTGKNWEYEKNVIHENLLLLEQTATMEAFECVFFNKCAISVVSIPIRC